MVDLGDKIITKKRFSEAVEKLVIDNRMPFIDAVVEVCEQTGLDPSEVNRLLTDSVKNKIEAEAMKLNMIPRTNELPFDD